MLDPVLNKQWIQKGKSKYINLMDKLCEFQETFALYLITRLPNPHFSPEDQAKCVVVDFTVTQCGSFNGPPYAIDATRLRQTRFRFRVSGRRRGRRGASERPLS